MTLEKLHSFASEMKFAPVSSTVTALHGFIKGYGSTFGGEPDCYGHVIAPGAFSTSLSRFRAAGEMPVMLWAHSLDDPIGAWTEMREDDRGLYLEGKLNPDVQRGREAISLIKQGAVTGLSIGFRTPPGSRVGQKDGTVLIKEIDLVEISVVPLPANTRARLTDLKGVRSLKDYEEFLRANGAAKSMARTLALKGWRPEAPDNSTLIQALAARMKAAAAELRSKG